MAVLKNCFCDLIIGVVCKIAEQVQQVFNDKVAELTIGLLDLLVDSRSKHRDQLLKRAIVDRCAKMGKDVICCNRALSWVFKYIEDGMKEVKNSLAMEMHNTPCGLKLMKVLIDSVQLYLLSSGSLQVLRLRYQLHFLWVD